MHLIQGTGAATHKGLCEISFAVPFGGDLPSHM